MKYLITGDFHIKEDRITEVENILSQIAKKTQSTKGIIILGDVFNHPRPTTLEIDCLLQFLNQIKGKKVYILGGNHDLDNKVFATKWVKKLPYNAKVFESLSTTLTLENKKLYLGHHGVAESVLGPEDYHLHKSSSYKNIQADAILLGHIHKSQIISTNPLVVHPGSPYFLNFGERNDKKGIGLLNIDNQSLTYSFEPLNVIKMIQLSIKENELDSVIDKLEKIPADTKVKLIINITKINSDIALKIKNIEKIYKKKFTLFKVEKIKNIETIHCKNKDLNSIKELLNNFCKDNKVSKAIKKKLEKIVLL